MAFSIKDLIENAGSVYLQGETIKSQRRQNNAPEDFERRETGVNSDGSTLEENQLVSGVSNNVLLITAVGLIALVTVAVVMGD